jgi:hypothetical protein
MLSILMVKCKKCRRTAVYGTHHKEPLYCSDHKSENDITVNNKCIQDDCKNAAINERCREHSVVYEPKPIVEIKAVAEAPNPIIELNARIASLERSAEQGTLAIGALRDRISSFETAISATMEAQLCSILDRYRIEDRKYKPKELYVNVLFDSKTVINMTASCDHIVTRQVKAGIISLNHETILPFMASMGFKLVRKNTTPWESYYRTASLGLLRGEIVYDMIFQRDISE